MKQGFFRDKWQSFRAWQEQPITYQRPGKTKHVCKNCGHRFQGNYCPVCSQPVGQGRITWITMWQGFGQLWGIESRSGLYTLWQLMWRPGYLVRDFISGKRQVSYPPVKLLFIVAAVVALIQYFFPAPERDISNSGYYYLDFAINWLDNHENINALLTGCFFILPTWILFRKAPRYPNHTIPEGFFIQVYLAILSFTFSSIFVESHAISVLLTAGYTYATYKQLFGYSYWGTFWRLMICSALSIVIIVLLIITGILLSGM